MSASKIYEVVVGLVGIFPANRSSAKTLQVAFDNTLECRQYKMSVGEKIAARKAFISCRKKTITGMKRTKTVRETAGPIFVEITRAFIQ